MTKKATTSNFLKKQNREYKFVPRIINPVKIENVVIFSADEMVRKASKTLKENMPWLNVYVLSDPGAVSNYYSDKPAVIILDDPAMTFVNTEKLSHNNKDVVCVLLSTYDFIHCSPPAAAKEKFPHTSKADLIFAVNKFDLAPKNIITAVVRCAEDRLNIEKYSTEKRFIFLIVDDEPRWFSQFLPVLYNIIGQRADVMVTRTYEETINFLFGVDDESNIDDERYQFSGHGDNVVCLITDMYFPQNNKLSSNAGKNILKLINKFYPRIPIIIASKAKEGYDYKDFAFILPKGDSGSLQILKGYIHDFTGMGDFFIRSKTGKVLYRIKDVREMYKILLEAEQNTKQAQELRELLEIYGEKDYFSTWLYMHGFRELGDKLRPKRDKGRRLVTVLKRHLLREILQMDYMPLTIDGIKIYNLHDLLNTLRTIDPVKIQQFSDNDIFSTWFDRNSYPELAEEFRPIHGSGDKLKKTLADIIEKWIEIYRQRGNL